MTGVPTCAPIIGQQLSARLRAFKRPEPVAAPLLAHEALKCPRRIGFRLFGVEPEIKYSRDELATFADGDFVDGIAAEVFAQQVNARTQVAFDWLPRLALKGKADVGYRCDGTKIIGEVKSTNEKAWSRAVGAWDGVPAAPKTEWLVQAGLAACSPQVEAEQVHIVLVDNERFEVAEWLLGVDDLLTLPTEPEPTSIRSLVDCEVDRLAIVLSTCEGGTLPPRDVPGFGLVEYPPGRDEDGPWPCRYCHWQPNCARLAKGPVHEFAEMAA